MEFPEPDCGVAKARRAGTSFAGGVSHWKQNMVESIEARRADTIAEVIHFNRFVSAFQAFASPVPSDRGLTAPAVDVSALRA